MLEVVSVAAVVAAVVVVVAYNKNNEDPFKATYSRSASTPITNLYRLALPRRLTRRAFVNCNLIQQGELRITTKTTTRSQSLITVLMMKQVGHSHWSSRFLKKSNAFASTLVFLAGSAALGLAGLGLEGFSVAPWGKEWIQPLLQ